MRNDRGLKYVLIILLCCFISACAHNPRQYTLQSDCYPVPFYPPTNKTLLIMPTRAAPELQGDAMLYSQCKNELEPFAKHQWIANPAKLLNTQIVEAAQQSHLYCAVVQAPFAGQTDFRLATKLVRLYQDFTRCPSHIVLHVDANISYTKTGRLISAKTFRIDVTAPSDTPYGGVIAANKASRILLQQLIAFLKNSTE